MSRFTLPRSCNLCELEFVLLTKPEQNALRAFHKFLVTPGEMLCFFGPDLDRHKAALQKLTEKEFLVKERFKGGYSLTEAGFVAMKECA